MNNSTENFTTIAREYLATLVGIQLMVIILLVLIVFYVPISREYFMTHKQLTIILMIVIGIFLATILPIILGKKFAKKGKYTR